MDGDFVIGRQRRNSTIAPPCSLLISLVGCECGQEILHDPEFVLSRSAGGSAVSNTLPIGMVDSYFFDTYAFYKLIEGNENYKPYLKVVIFTTQMNLMELHYGLMVKYGKDEADRIYDELRKYAVDVSDDIIKTANEFRKTHSRRRLSYVDCVGYMAAKSLGIPFLTGDKEFRDLETVKFVK